MKPEDIGKAYDRITHLWESEGFNRENGVIQHERAIAFCDQRGMALDVGCGCTGRFIDLLLNNGFTPEGVDVSQEMLGLAKQKHPGITFYQQDICQWHLPQKYDFISAWDSIWHVPLAEQEAVIKKLLAALNPKGVLIFSFGGVDRESDHLDSTMGPEMYYATLGVSGFLNVIMAQGCVCRHLEYDQYPEMHTYLIAQKL
ncbi:class I SAM-dependent methyltransferase [Teredinibacter sp. KSP-S5-2]|uniref:class I SAM-dependent methyltransferase n=1 Tax=Teredinibacter sp. KSP-S5-2 TaxID=3034506 RepID=UPI002934D2EA|nr:class I SAM-dependent methyltransferase [Teredinibacter sp. KSP-S5-2]WNO08259.1 class I SAM-dependent methyltransferase [Teredinibacter sp. KSP-S5-2]